MPPSAHAPVNGVPVANQSEGEQQKGDQQQARSLRGINRVPLVLVGIVLASSANHDFIVRRAETVGAASSDSRSSKFGLYSVR
jgi:hypothetical protein